MTSEARAINLWHDIAFAVHKGESIIPLILTHDDEIRRESWKELHAEAETQYDQRVESLGPIETDYDALFRKTLSDGWSAWLLAKHIIDNRAAIMGKE